MSTVDVYESKLLSNSILKSDSNPTLTTLQNCEADRTIYPDWQYPNAIAYLRSYEDKETTWDDYKSVLLLGTQPCQLMGVDFRVRKD